MKTYLFIPAFILLAACGNHNQNGTHSSHNTVILIDTIAVIGAESQPFEHQLGEPIAVVTDSGGNIYIADRASLSVKVFSQQGEYLRSFGGRGRGPGEFQWMNMMSPAGGDTLVFQDRGKLEYMYMTSKGELISAHPENLSRQYYPQSVKWYNGHSIGLMQGGSDPRVGLPPIERPLFYVYDKKFHQRKTTFFSSNQMGYTESDMFIWAGLVPFPGSFDLSPERETLIYSPGVYNGQLYEFTPSDSLQWQLSQTINAQPAHSPAFENYHSETEYEKMYQIPGVNRIYFPGGPYYGRLYSIDAGVFYMADGNTAHFYGEWQGKDTTLEEGNALELFVQIISPQGELLDHGWILSIERDRRPSVSLVNWKDEQDNFYLLNLGDYDVPTVIKFRLNLEEKNEAQHFSDL